MKPSGRGVGRSAAQLGPVSFKGRFACNNSGMYLVWNQRAGSVETLFTVLRIQSSSNSKYSVRDPKWFWICPAAVSMDRAPKSILGGPG
jgi:hypothetical protein